MGNTFGRKGDGDMQRAILTDALEMLHACKTPATLKDLPYRWHETEYRPEARSFLSIRMNDPESNHE